MCLSDKEDVEMNRFFAFLCIIKFSIYMVVGIAVISEATVEKQPPPPQKQPHPSEKRVAVLYFKDSSNFDNPVGCGCIPNFVGAIFSTKKMWDLEAGFITMLDRKLAETSIYQPVSRDELLDAMAEMTLSRRSVMKLTKDQREKLAKLLKAEVLVIGEIKKFGQNRIKANASRSLTESGRESQAVPISTSYMTRFAAMGHRNRAFVKLEMKFYEASGNEIATVPIDVSRRDSLAGTNIAGLKASVTESGTEFQFGQTKERQGKLIRPITKPTQLNKIKFASPEYDLTLFGMVTNEAMIETVIALRDNFGPNFITPWETPEQSDDQEKQVDDAIAKRPIKITYVDTDNQDMIYINAGSAKRLAIGQQFAVYTDGSPIHDVDTGEILDYTKKKIATVSVTEILSNKLSVVRIVEKIGDIKRGDLLKSLSTDEVPKEE